MHAHDPAGMWEDLPHRGDLNALVGSAFEDFAVWQQVEVESTVARGILVDAPR